MKSIVLVIDIQKGIRNLKPYNLEQFLLNVNTVLDEAREKKIEVIYIQHDGGEGTPFAPGEVSWEIMDEVKPLEGELVIHKKFNSAFRRTELERTLKEKGVKKLIIMGMQTEYCIDTTIRVAFEKEYEIIIPKDTNTTVLNEHIPARDIVEYHNYSIFHGRFGMIKELDKVFE